MQVLKSETTPSNNPFSTGYSSSRSPSSSTPTMMSTSSTSYKKVSMMNNNMSNEDNFFFNEEVMPVQAGAVPSFPSTFHNHSPLVEGMFGHVSTVSPMLLGPVSSQQQQQQPVGTGPPSLSRESSFLGFDFFSSQQHTTSTSTSTMVAEAHDFETGTPMMDEEGDTTGFLGVFDDDASSYPSSLPSSLFSSSSLPPHPSSSSSSSSSSSYRAAMSKKNFNPHLTSKREMRQMMMMRSEPSFRSVDLPLSLSMFESAGPNHASSSSSSSLSPSLPSSSFDFDMMGSGPSSSSTASGSSCGMSISEASFSTSLSSSLPSSSLPPSTPSFGHRTKSKEKVVRYTSESQPPRRKQCMVATPRDDHRMDEDIQEAEDEKERERRERERRVSIYPPLPSSSPLSSSSSSSSSPRESIEQLCPCGPAFGRVDDASLRMLRVLSGPNKDLCFVVFEPSDDKAKLIKAVDNRRKFRMKKGEAYCPTCEMKVHILICQPKDKPHLDLVPCSCRKKYCDRMREVGVEVGAGMYGWCDFKQIEGQDAISKENRNKIQDSLSTGRSVYIRFDGAKERDKIGKIFDRHCSVSKGSEKMYKSNIQQHVLCVDCGSVSSYKALSPWVLTGEDAPSTTSSARSRCGSRSSRSSSPSSGSERETSSSPDGRSSSCDSERQEGGGEKRKRKEKREKKKRKDSHRKKSSSSSPPLSLSHSSSSDSAATTFPPVRPYIHVHEGVDGNQPIWKMYALHPRYATEFVDTCSEGSLSEAQARFPCVLLTICYMKPGLLLTEGHLRQFMKTEHYMELMSKSAESLCWLDGH